MRVGSDVDEQALSIAETFVSLQGEGKLAGVASWFVRVSGCNLRCRWCDTPYASWSPEGGVRSVASLASEARSSGVGHAVVTGGEPMMFGGVAVLARALREVGLHVTIETAGTVWRETACDLMSISPKLGNSTPVEGDGRDPGGVWRVRHEERRVDVGVVQRLLDAHGERQLKFVVMEERDLEEVEGLLARLRGWRREEVMLMPEGVERSVEGRTGWVVRACVERGWRYCHRLHIELFGNRRGT